MMPQKTFNFSDCESGSSAEYKGIRADYRCAYKHSSCTQAEYKSKPDKFDYTDAIEILCADICRTVPELKHINMDYVTAKIMAVKSFKLEKLNDFITYLDTGYGVDETKKIIQTMYKNKNINWETQLLDFVLLVYERSEN